MWVRHMGACHPDHVQQASLHSMTCSRNIRNACGVERWHPRRLADSPGKIKMRRAFHTLNRDHVCHSRIGVDTPFDDIQKVYLTGRRKAFGNLQPFIWGNAAFLRLICGITQANYKFGADPFADGFYYVHRKAHAIFKSVSAVRPCQVIGQRRPKLVKQMAVNLQLYPIHTS